LFRYRWKVQKRCGSVSSARMIVSTRIVSSERPTVFYKSRLHDPRLDNRAPDRGSRQHLAYRDVRNRAHARLEEISGMQTWTHLMLSASATKRSPNRKSDLAKMLFGVNSTTYKRGV
jgi:hypothetical protein